MERLELKKVAMYNVVFQFLNKTNPTILAKMPHIDEAIAKLNQNINQIIKLGGLQAENKKGITQVKKISKTEAINAFFILAGSIKSWANNTNNLILGAEVNFSITKLTRLSDASFVVAVNLILKKAIENQTHLANYGITPQTIQEHRILIQNFNNNYSKPRLHTSEKKHTTQTIKELIKQTSQLLRNHIDTLVIIVKNTDNTFYKAYHSNRKIINPVHIPLALRCQVLDTNNQPIYKVTITIKKPNIKRRTSKNGIIKIQTLPKTTHIITFQREGYTTKTLKVKIIKNLRTDLKVILEKIKE